MSEHALFTLDSTTLFFYNLSNDAHSSQTTKQQIIEEWARGIPANAYHNSAPSLTTASKSSRTQTTTRSAFQTGIKWNDYGGLSGHDEINGAEADLARRAPKKGKVRVNSNHLVRVVSKEKKPEMKNHPLLGTKEFRPVGVPTAFVWAAAQADPWNLGGDKAIRRAFQKIAEVIWIEGSRYIDDLVMTQVTQRISDTWHASIGSAALMIVNGYFELQPGFKDSDEARQEYSRMQLQGHEFLYGRGVSGSVNEDIFRGNLVILTFAQHLNAIKGAIGVKHTCPTQHAYGALVLASVAVKRALTLWARKWITIKAVRQAENTGTPIRFPNLVNDKTGVESNSYAQFSQVIWGKDTQSLMASAQILTDDDFDVITTEAQNFINTRCEGSSEIMRAPSEDLLPMEISGDNAEEQWLANFFATYSQSSHASYNEDPCPCAICKGELASRHNIMPPRTGARHNDLRYQENSRGEDRPNREESFRRRTHDESCQCCEASPPPRHHFHEDLKDTYRKPSRRRTREELDIEDRGSLSGRRRRRIKWLRE